MNQNLRIFAVDPGTHVVGYGVIEAVDRELQYVAAGAIRAGKKTDPIEKRLGEVYLQLKQLISQHRPTILVLEQAFYGKSIEAAIRLGEGRGVALLCAAEASIPVAEYPPATVKKAVVGHGTADKAQVASMIRALLKLSEVPKPADATDALALAICHGHREAL